MKNVTKGLLLSLNIHVVYLQNISSWIVRRWFNIKELWIYFIDNLRKSIMYNNLSLLDIEKWSNQCFRYHKISLFHPPIYHLDILDDYQEHTWQILGHQWRRKALSELLSNLHLCFRSLQSETIEMCTKCIKYSGTFRFL